MKHIFSTRLYKDALRRTRNISLALFVIALAWTLIQFTGHASTFRRYPEYTPYDSPSAMVSILPLYMFIMGAGLALSAFSFLNRRNSSDFYHAISYSRLCLFTSTMAACITRMLSIIAVVLLVPTVGCLITGIPFYYAFLPRLILSCLAGTLFIWSAAAIAMSITGTAFSNLILTGLIVFLPRFITTLASFLISDASPIVPLTGMGLLFDFSYNIPVGLFLSVFDFYGIGDIVLLSTSSIIYTFAVSLLYSALAAFAFVKRKSEAAENSSPSRVLQCIYRCAVGSVFALVAVALLLAGEDEPILIMTCIAISFVSFFLFELITQKSIRTTFKALPTYGFVIATAIVFFFGVRFSTYALQNVSPEANDVKYIQLNSDSEMYAYDSLPYSETAIAKAKITSKDAIEYAVKHLNESVEFLSTRNDISFFQTYNTKRCITFKLKNGMTVTRYVCFMSSEYEKFQELLLNDESFVAAQKQLPSKKHITHYGCAGLDSSSAVLLWESYKKEYEESGKLPSNFADSYTEYEYSPNRHPLLTLDGFNGYYYFTGAYWINPEDTPETMSLYLSMMKDNALSENYLETMRKGIRDGMMGEVETENGTSIVYTHVEAHFVDKEYALLRAEELGLADAIVDTYSFPQIITADASPQYDNDYSSPYPKYVDIFTKGKLSDSPERTLVLSVEIYSETIDNDGIYMGSPTTEFFIALEFSQADYDELLKLSVDELIYTDEVIDEDYIYYD